MLVGLSAAVTVLMASAAAAGVFGEGVYHDNGLVRAGWLGNDLVTLLVAVPLLGGATWRARQGAARARLVCLGLLAYALYNYAFYLFGASYNGLFLAYVAILACSTFGLIAGVTSPPLGRIAATVRTRPAHRAVGAVVLLISLMLGLFWMALAVRHLATGEVPPMVAATGHPTNVTGALDLWLVVSFGALAGYWLLNGRAWGYVVATIWTLKGSVYMAALTAATVAARWTGHLDDMTQLALWVPIGVACTIGAAVLLRDCPRTSG